jgi:hypothetical protein
VYDDDVNAEIGLENQYHLVVIEFVLATCMTVGLNEVRTILDPSTCDQLVMRAVVSLLV